MQKIANIIKKISGKYTTYAIFVDWVKMLAISIQNSVYLVDDELWAAREKEFSDLRNKYSEVEFKLMREMYAELVNVLANKQLTDFLGEIYMEAGCASKSTGQFFTPFSVCYTNARIVTPHNVDTTYKLHEPTCGSGGMIVAVAKVLDEHSINYQKVLRVIAQDLDWTGCYMTYVTLSLLGIDAIVVQGDALEEPFDPKGYPKEKILYTPKRMGMMGFAK